MHGAFAAAATRVDYAATASNPAWPALFFNGGSSSASDNLEMTGGIALLLGTSPLA